MKNKKNKIEKLLLKYVPMCQKTTAFIFINMSVEILCVSKADTARKNGFLKNKAKFPGFPIVYVEIRFLM